MDKTWLRNALKSRGRGAQAELSTVLGLHPTVISKLVHGPRGISSQEADKIRAWLAAPGEPQGGLLGDLPVQRRQSLSESPASPSTMSMSDRPDIPVWASVAAGDGEGSMILTAEPIDYIRRTERTANVRDPWAFHIVGDSMLERLAQGDQVIINPAMPLLPGADCVFVHQADDGIMYGLVKRLLRANADVWRVRQLNPAKDFELGRRKWSKAYRIAEIRPRM